MKKEPDFLCTLKTCESCINYRKENGLAVFRLGLLESARIIHLPVGKKFIFASPVNKKTRRKLQSKRGMKALIESCEHEWENSVCELCGVRREPDDFSSGVTEE